MQLTFVGSGDAFGSGGRFNTCFHVGDRNTQFLIDCGASSVIALKRMKIDRNAVETIFVTHFHGDHFGGIPYFILDAQFFSKRTAPLTIVGPQGLAAWLERVMEATFPGSSTAKRKFEVILMEATPGETQTINGVAIDAAHVRHGPVKGPFLAYRLTLGDKTIAYTGDTEWVDDLVDIGRDADLFIAEAYVYDRRVPLHLDLATLKEKLPQIAPKRLILTHMTDDMLGRLSEVPFETAEDGKIVVL